MSGARSKLLTVAEAAAYLNTSERWVRRAIFERRLPVIHLGRHVRLDEHDLVDYIAANREPAQTAHGVASIRRLSSSA